MLRICVKRRRGGLSLKHSTSTARLAGLQATMSRGIWQSKALGMSLTARQPIPTRHSRSASVRIPPVPSPLERRMRRSIHKKGKSSGKCPTSSVSLQVVVSCNDEDNGKTLGRASASYIRLDHCLCIGYILKPNRP